VLAAGVLYSAGRGWLIPLVILGAVPGALAAARGRAWGVAAVLVACFLLPQAALLIGRPPTAPVQDGLLITDAAARRLIHGLSPYGHDYIDDPALRAFWITELPVNPLLAHYIYPPGMILLTVPLALAGLSAAWLWLPGPLALAGGAWLAAGRAGAVAVALSPLLLLDSLYLFNDLFFLAAGLAAAGLLLRGRAWEAAVLAAAALLLKQVALILLPALALLAWRLGPRRAALFGAATVAIVLLVLAPFLAWSPHGFLADTGAYFYGSGVDAFPIRGPGLPGLLLSAGALPSRWAGFPSAALQFVVLVPLLGAGWVYLRRRTAGAGIWLWTAAIALALFFLGRTLAPNYVTVAAVLLTLSWLQWRAPSTDATTAPPATPA
jgi:hypothetical protein